MISCASRICRVSIMFWRKTSTASAIVPSSSRRSRPGIAMSVSPPDRRFIVAVIAVSGRDIERPIKMATRMAMRRMTTVPSMRSRRAVVAAAA